MEPSLLKKIKDLRGYMEKHTKNLGKDIKNVKAGKNSETPDFFEGAMSATKLFMGCLNDIIVDVDKAEKDVQ